VLCPHCDNAPCEPVCPVHATYHNPEGLNVQVYNRCVGTFYCANNCPYTVRYFNWFEPEWPEPLELQHNPDVAVRTVGVMEKCTFCIQRIKRAKESAARDGRTPADGDVNPACVQSCPAEAMVFGDLNDSESRVSRLAQNGRATRLLEELGTKPKVFYLQKVK
jgi:Fe-S-cluster-containing dehydrogenase component